MHKLKHFLPFSVIPFCANHPNLYELKAKLLLISAMANAGFKPFGHVLEQLRMVWHRYKLMLLLSASFRWAVFSSLLSAIQRYDWRSTAGPRYSSLFHQ
jgi:hypothetical protein